MGVGSGYRMTFMGVVGMCANGYGWMSNGGWGWGWMVTAVVMILVFAVVITAIVVAVRYLMGAEHRSRAARPIQGPGAEDVLAQRFARGDIDDTEYRQRITTLREHR